MSVPQTRYWAFAALLLLAFAINCFPSNQAKQRAIDTQTKIGLYDCCCTWAISNAATKMPATPSGIKASAPDPGYQCCDQAFCIPAEAAAKGGEPAPGKEPAAVAGLKAGAGGLKAGKTSKECCCLMDNAQCGSANVEYFFGDRGTCTNLGYQCCDDSFCNAVK